MGTYLTDESKLKQLNRVRAYYEENKVDINRNNRIKRAEAKLRTEEEKKELRAAMARRFYLNNRDALLVRQKEYYQNNKEVQIAAQIARRNKKYAEQQALGSVNAIKQKVKAGDDDGTSTFIARAAIAKNLVITLIALDRLARTPRYEMPKPVSVHVNGAYLYNRKEIEDWYPYARELLSWAVAGERVSRSRRPFAFKVGTLGHAMIMFMRNNKKVVEHCAKERTSLRMKFVGGL